LSPKKFLGADGTCAACGDNFVIMRRSDIQQVCVPCTNSACKKCDPEDSCLCLECVNSAKKVSYKYRESYDPSNICVTCNEATTDYFNGYHCYKAADGDCGANCAKCASENTCNTCSTGYYMTLDGRCYRCPEGCTDCEDATHCCACDKDHFLLDESSCVECCNEGFLKSGKLSDIDFFVLNCFFFNQKILKT
jgi:hypothetical protein